MENIGTKIKFHRKRKKLSQEDLSCDILNRVTISRIENNLQEPSLSQVNHICICLGISISELVNQGTHDNKINNSYSIDFLSSLYNAKNFYDIVKFYDLEKNKFNNIGDKVKLFYLGQSYYELKMYKNAKKFINTYLNYILNIDESSVSNSVYKLCTALNSIFIINMHLDQNEMAIKYLKLAENYIYKFHIETSDIAHGILNNIVIFYLRKNQYKKLINYCKYFEAPNTPLIYPKIAINIHKSLAIAYYNIGDSNKSIINTKKVINLYSYLGDTYNVGLSYINYLNALMYDAKFSEALTLLKKCQETYKSNVKLSNIFLVQEMIIYFNMKEFDRVLSISSIINKKQLRNDFLQDFHFILGHINYLTGNVASSIKEYNYCEAGYLRCNYNYDLCLMYDDLFNLTSEEKYRAKKQLLDFKRMQKNIILDLNKIPK